MTEARSNLAVKYLPLAWHVLGRFRRAKEQARGVDFNELRSAAMWGLIKAAIAFEPSVETSFKVFAQRCIRNELFDTMSSELNRSKRHFPVLEGDVGECGEFDETPLSVATVKRMRRCLPLATSKRQAKAVRYVIFQGMLHREAAERLGVSRRTVTEWVNQAKLAMRDHAVFQLAWDEFRGVA